MGRIILKDSLGNSVVGTHIQSHTLKGLRAGLLSNCEVHRQQEFPLRARGLSEEPGTEAVIGNLGVSAAAVSGLQAGSDVTAGRAGGQPGQTLREDIRVEEV